MTGRSGNAYAEGFKAGERTGRMAAHAEMSQPVPVAQGQPNLKQIEAAIDDYLGNIDATYEDSRRRCAQSILNLYAVPSTASGSVVQTEQLREALTLGRDAIMESFEHVASRDDQILADARLQSIDAAIAGQPRTHLVSLPIALVQRLRDHLEQTDSFVWLDEIEMLGVALSSTDGAIP